MKKPFLALIFFSIASYILLPIVDEAFVHPVVGAFLSSMFDIPLAKGFFFSTIIYRGVGILFLLLGLIISGKIVYKKFVKKKNK